ncbi:MAG TPA: hypothetical protein VE981_17200 [Planctomycetota bacterium]|nr:hypothetical protein [Planctomycetota bacterium]
MSTLLLALAMLAAQAEPACEKCHKPLRPLAVRWEDSPSQAAKKAKAEEKLVFVVHCSSGPLDPRGALNDATLGAYFTRNFVCAFQRLPGLGDRPGGSVASYFCAPDGRVLHIVAGAVDAAALLAEATWVVEASTKAIEESRRTEVPFKALFRKAHAERLRRNYGLVVEPVTFDAVEPSEDDPLTWRDPSGRPAAPPLVIPPLDGPDVQFRAAAKEQKGGIPDRQGRCWQMSAQSRVHQLLAAHALVKIERVYATVFESLLQQRIADKPWQCLRACDVERMRICLACGE